jgi:hypothetical protein
MCTPACNKLIMSIDLLTDLTEYNKTILQTQINKLYSSDI